MLRRNKSKFTKVYVSVLTGTYKVRRFCPASTIWILRLIKIRGESKRGPLTMFRKLDTCWWWMTSSWLKMEKLWSIQLVNLAKV